MVLSRTPSVRNTTTDIIPPYGCMELAYDGSDATELVDDIETVFKVKEPEAGVGRHAIMINGSAPLQEEGRANPIDGGVFLALVSTTQSLSPGDSIGPGGNGWAMGPDGSGFVYVSEDQDAYRESSSTRACWVQAAGGTGVQFYAFEVVDAVGLADPGEYLLKLLNPQDQTTVVSALSNGISNWAMYNDLVALDKGTCIFQNGIAYIVDAPCDAFSPSSDGGGGGGVGSIPISGTPITP